MKVDNHSITQIDTQTYYYIGNEFGHAICQNHFSDSDSAINHYRKCMKKVNYPVYICLHTVAAGEEIRI